MVEDITIVSVKCDPHTIPFTPEAWDELGGHLSLYVKNALSTRGHPINQSQDIHFSHVPYLSGSRSPKIFIEIRTFGFPDRKAKVENTSLGLKNDILDFLRTKGLKLRDEDKLLLIEYIDPSSRYF
jgi:hypothetical protein